MAEQKPVTTAELNAAAMKRMEEAKPTPTPEEINKAKLGLHGDAKLPERTEEQKKADEEQTKQVEAANKRMHETVPTPTQAEVDEFKIGIVERMGGKRSEADKKAAEDDAKARAERNAEASTRMEGSQPTPTQAEIDLFVTCRGKTAEEINEILDDKPGGGPQKKEATAGPAATSYRTRAMQPPPAEEKKD